MAIGIGGVQPRQHTAQRRGIGFNGFDYTEYRDNYKVVPQDTPRADLPTIVRWSDGAGAPHVTHMRAGDYDKFRSEVLGLHGGFISQLAKAQPGTRWVPDFRGDY